MDTASQLFVNEVVARVKARMTGAGLSVKQLAEQTEIPRSTLIRRLAGESDFTLQEMLRIARALHVDVLDLLATAAHEVPA